MTSYITQMTLGPVGASMVGRDKGDFSNRTKCAGAQVKNAVTTSLLAGGASAACVAGGLYLAKNPRKLVKIAQFFDKVAGKILPKSVNLKAISKMSKVGIVLGLPVLALGSFIGGRHTYKMGQIDQKYTDRATLKEHQNDILA